MPRRKKVLGVSEEDLRAVDDFLAKESELLWKKDVNGLLALYAEDTVLLPPDMDAVQGREAIKRLYEHWFSVYGDIEQKATALDVVGMGDALAVRYTYIFKDQRKGQKATESRGRGVALFKRTSEGWKILWDVWNYPPPLKQGSA